ncbi:MAG: ribonuclease [Anaerotignum sp.]|nr:ribonuclease [Anaerotignum sp.]
MIEPMEAIRAGDGTKDGAGGADVWLKVVGKLPPNYISYSDAKKLGWNRKKGNLNQVAPGRMLTRGRCWNDDGHLPESPGRIWYEADINYKWGYRGNDRILYSNDGLIFVTYNHYKTFIEIV